MKNLKKVLRLFLLMFIFTTTVMLGAGFTEKAKAAELTDSPVQLSYAKYVNVGYYGGAMEGYICVKNLAYNKNVVVHYLSGSSWNDVNATYLKTNADGSEIWHFYTNFNGLSTKFAIKYEVNGQTYWDNNNNQDYSVDYQIHDYTLGNSEICLTQASKDGVNADGTRILRAQACLKNLATAPTNVKIRYTEDNWTTYKEVLASPSTYKINNDLLKYYDMTIGDISSTTTQVKFAVSGVVNGVEYWDNNFGSDYVINY